MYAQRRTEDPLATSALVHNTQLDTDVEATVVSHTLKELVLYFRQSDSRVKLSRTDTRRPYVGRLGPYELTVLDADIE